jgi:hypothetical protein
MKHQLSDLTNVLRRPVESTADSRTSLDMKLGEILFAAWPEEELSPIEKGRPEKERPLPLNSFLQVATTSLNIGDADWLSTWIR